MKTMKAVVLREIGNLDKLVYQEVEFPNAKPGQVIVRMKAAALNHRDWWIVQGLYAKIRVPVILGSDGTGVVQSAGDPKDDAWIGRSVVIHPSQNWGDNPKAQSRDFRIFGMPDNGTQAEYAAVPVENLFLKPDYLTDDEAAATPLCGLTAYRALITQGKIAKNETVLITGIGGGVASLAMQIALGVGARVIVSSGSDEKIDRAVKAGARFGTNYRHPDWPKSLETEAQKLGGVDLIVDGAGGKEFNDLLAVVRPGGRIVSYGATAGNPDAIDLRKIFWKQITVQGSTMGHRDDFTAMLTFFEQHGIKPVLDTVFPLDQFRSAYERMMHGEQFGKIVLKT